VLIVYVALLLDLVLSPAAPGENDNASGVGVALRLAERLDGLEYFGVHVLLTGSQKAMAQGMRAFLKAHRKEFPEDTVVVNVDAVGGGEIRLTKKEGPLLTVSSNSQLTGAVDVETVVNREPSDGYAAASARLAAVTVTATSDRLEEETLSEAEETCVEIVESLDEELS
jgi:Zn-dependent M28 family amino/carboxypeptidase